jgi:opacity protein-like surface antigen
MEFGGHAMAGVEIRLSRGLSLNLDYRYTRIGSSSGQHALGGAMGVHW